MQHSKLWTRKFPNAKNVLRQCQRCLAPIFARHDADEALIALLQRQEALHASDDKFTSPFALGRGSGAQQHSSHSSRALRLSEESDALQAAVEELEAAMARHAPHASRGVVAWGIRALEARRELHSFTARAADTFVMPH